MHKRWLMRGSCVTLTVTVVFVTCELFVNSSHLFVTRTRTTDNKSSEMRSHVCLNTKFSKSKEVGSFFKNEESP